MVSLKHTIYKSPVYTLTNSQAYSRVNSTGFTITLKRNKFKKLMINSETKYF